MALPPVFLLLPLLLLSGIQAAEYQTVPIEISVTNQLTDSSPQNFGTRMVKGGILLGAMRTLMNSNSGFKFIVTEDPNFGPFLESVNGLAGSVKDHTYWELLVQKSDGRIIRPNVGVGCYVPSAHEKIIFNFRKIEALT